jgi:hypothetical protein
LHAEKPSLLSSGSKAKPASTNCSRVRASKKGAKAVTADLAQGGAERYAHLTISGNRAR